jgi:hypothetical protein
VALRIYPDNRPKNLEIAALQKDILVVNGSELIEEGGFGVCKIPDTTLLQKNKPLLKLEKIYVIKKSFLIQFRKRVHGAFIIINSFSFHKP